MTSADEICHFQLQNEHLVEQTLSLPSYVQVYLAGEHYDSPDSDSTQSILTPPNLLMTPPMPVWLCPYSVTPPFALSLLPYSMYPHTALQLHLLHLDSTEKRDSKKWIITINDRVNVEWSWLHLPVLDWWRMPKSRGLPLEWNTSSETVNKTNHKCESNGL